MCLLLNKRECSCVVCICVCVFCICIRTKLRACIATYIAYVHIYIFVYMPRASRCSTKLIKPPMHTNPILYTGVLCLQTQNTHTHSDWGSLQTLASYNNPIGQLKHLLYRVYSVRWLLRLLRIYIYSPNSCSSSCRPVVVGVYIYSSCHTLFESHTFVIVIPYI